MYVGALIQLPDGTRKVVSGLGFLKYAKKQNKLIKIICDSPIALGTLSKQLPGVQISYGIKGELELEMNKDEPQKT